MRLRVETVQIDIRTHTYAFNGPHRDSTYGTIHVNIGLQGYRIRILRG
jgi:hypothetical protein